MSKSVDQLIKKCHNSKELNKLIDLSDILEYELQKIKKQIKKMGLLGASPIEFDKHDFQIRSCAYGLAFEIAPKARDEDLVNMSDWINLQENDMILDVSAGTGFLSKHLAEQTSATIYALDPSIEQLKILENTKNDLDIQVVCGSPHEISIFQQGKLKGQEFDIITSYGGLHHIVEENGQVSAFNNFAKILPNGGRVIVGDVGGGSKLANHFETSVTQHCLTSHVQKWITKDRLQTELTRNNSLELIRCEEVPVRWRFSSELQMALFMKALHADPRNPDEVIEDLNNKLGYTKQEEVFLLNWPMLFFELINKK